MLYLNSKSKFKGFSLLELLLVMGSFAAIVAIGFWIYSLAAERQRINTAQKQLASIQKGMNDILVAASNIDEARAMLLQGKSLPSNMISGNNLVNPWSGKITITPRNGSDTFYDVSYYNVPTPSCIDLVNKSRIFFTTVTSSNSSLTSTDNTSGIANFCSKIAKNDAIVFSNFYTGDTVYEASVSNSISTSTSISSSISTSTSVSASTSASKSISTSLSLSNSISASTSVSISNSISASISTSASISNSISASKSASTSTSLSNSISASTSASISNSISSSISASKSASTSASLSNSISSSVSASKSASTSTSISASTSASTSASLSVSASKSISISKSASAAAVNNQLNQVKSTAFVISEYRVDLRDDDTYNSIFITKKTYYVVDGTLYVGTGKMYIPSKGGGYDQLSPTQELNEKLSATDYNSFKSKFVSVSAIKKIDQTVYNNALNTYNSTGNYTPLFNLLGVNNDPKWSSNNGTVNNVVTNFNTNGTQKRNSDIYYDANY